MDSLTQIVLGAAVGEAVLGKKVGNKAMLYGAIAGTIPDLDTFASAFTDTITAIEIHRGFTHSIVFSILFAPIFGWLISKVEKKSIATWQNWSWLMFWGLFTHPLLDSHTTWGTQLFWPLEVRLAYKNIFVIDPLYTLPFLVFLILAMRQERGTKKRRKLNNLGLVISSIYLLVITPALKLYTFNKFTEALEDQDIAYYKIETKPSPLNAVLWSANVEVDDAYLIGNYSIFDTQPIEFVEHPKNHQFLGDWIEKRNVKRLIDISKGWYTISKRDEDIYFNDLRFGTLSPIARADADFAFSYKLVEENGEIKAIETEKTRGDAKELLSQLGNRILGN
ncbi:metal-dependent hydrolase [Salegentibacter mishustinae]|uniref:metal-dependent hydrolase n=1 Tax=Salegentibacter mishustinae TaxID=270918 RepID=UPI001CE23195|nr:metal-dependent hydrolase [Salegentibacter mishustinae]UBZ07474.1 metal-dependent hydrolase [Salegentibacter mishustinae]